MGATKQDGVKVTLQACTLEMLGSDIDRENYCPEHSLQSIAHILYMITGDAHYMTSILQVIYPYFPKLLRNYFHYCYNLKITKSLIDISSSFTCAHVCKTQRTNRRLERQNDDCNGKYNYNKCDLLLCQCIILPQSCYIIYCVILYLEYTDLFV